MKKFAVALVAMTALALLVSCASQKGAKSSGSSKSDGAFDKVYTQAREKLNLKGAQSYTVVEGDTLTSITKQSYGDGKGYYFPLIMAASSDVVTDPDLIVPGMELVVPDFDANMNDPQIKGTLKGVFKKVASIYSKQGKADMKAALLKVADSL